LQIYSSYANSPARFFGFGSKLCDIDVFQIDLFLVFRVFLVNLIEFFMVTAFMACRVLFGLVSRCLLVLILLGFLLILGILHLIKS